MSHTYASLFPYPDDDYQPTATLLHYDDGHTIPVINFAPDGRWQVNLGMLGNAGAAAYLHHLAREATQLAGTLTRAGVGS